MHRWVAAVMLVLMAGGAGLEAQDAASARAFVTEIYRHYEKGGSGIAGDELDRYLDPSLKKLLDEDLDLANDPRNLERDLEAIDGDYFVNAQDSVEVSDFSAAVAIDKPGHATAALAMEIYAPQDRFGDPDQDRRRVRLTLVAGPGGWRVWDIVFLGRNRKPESFRAGLTRGIAANRRLLAEAAEGKGEPAR